MAKTTALVPFHGADIASASTLSDKLCKSRLLPDDLRGNASDILVTILAGRELGLDPMAAIRGIHVVKGKPVLAADLMLALVLRSGHCEYFTLVESDAKRALYKTKRHGADEVTMAYDIEQAKAAKLTSKHTWQQFPEAMIRARCISALARAVYPDLLYGCYCTDEGEEIARATAPTAATDAEVIDEPAGVDAVDHYTDRIAAAGGVAAMDRIAVEIRGLDPATREQLRPVYSARLAALKEPAPPGRGPGVAAAQAESDEAWMDDPGDDLSDVPQ